MEKNNKYYSVIENLVKNHRKYQGLETLLDDIIDDVYQHSEVIINTVKNENVVIAYLEKVVATSIITVPKKYNFHSEISHAQISTKQEPVISVNNNLVDTMINSMNSHDNDISQNTSDILVETSPAADNSVDLSIEQVSINEESFAIDNDLQEIESDENVDKLNDYNDFASKENVDIDEEEKSETIEDNTSENSILFDENDNLADDILNVENTEMSHDSDVNVETNELEFENFENTNIIDVENNDVSILEDNETLNTVVDEEKSQDDFEESNSLSMTDSEISDNFDDSDDSDESPLIPFELNEGFPESQFVVEEDTVSLDNNTENNVLLPEEEDSLNLADNLSSFENEQTDVELNNESNEITELQDVTEELSSDDAQDLSIEFTNEDNMEINFSEDENSLLEVGSDETLEIDYNQENSLLGTNDAIENDEQKLVDYSKFSYNPNDVEEEDDNFDIETIVEDINDLDEKNPDEHIIEIYNMKFKDKKSVTDIANKLNLNEDVVIDVLNKLVSLI